MIGVFAVGVGKIYVSDSKPRWYRLMTSLFIALFSICQGMAFAGTASFSPSWIASTVIRNFR